MGGHVDKDEKDLATAVAKYDGGLQARVMGGKSHSWLATWAGQQVLPEMKGGGAMLGGRGIEGWRAYEASRPR